MKDENYGNIDRGEIEVCLRMYYDFLSGKISSNDYDNSIMEINDIF